MRHSYLLAGISSGKLIRLLARNGFSIYPKYLFRILFLLQGSIFASIFNRIEKMKMAKKLEKFSMPADPVFIIGHWRTGSTLLHQLMSLDSNMVTPNVLQVSTPESFLVSEKFYKPVMSKAMKTTRPMDNVKLDVLQPQEDEYALIKLTMDSPLEIMIFPEGNKYFLSDASFLPENEEKWKASLYNFCLRLSYIKGKRVLLKNPFHSMRIPLLLELFPQAKFIHIHRNPYEVVPSTIHMWNIVGGENNLNNKEQKITVADVSVIYNKMLNQIQKQLEKIPVGRKAEISFQKLEKDPIDALKKIYKELDLEFSDKFENLIKKSLSAVRSHKKNTYQLSQSDKEIIRDISGKQFIYYNYK